MNMHKCLFLVSLLPASVICVDNNSTMTAWDGYFDTLSGVWGSFVSDSDATLFEIGMLWCAKF
ncbi:unnamed protein product [Schistosoma mattheei]|uniref:Uncharacterized protein n=1 Tax=Schistosoma mattheei TaxID=31246 RepID=A0AA85B9R8_9TREM|nr:unnamed protein product [Schistosoma mattheei]CAH8606187.1 unnamed protein product [Schistosoma mattheei]